MFLALSFIQCNNPGSSGGGCYGCFLQFKIAHYLNAMFWFVFLNMKEHACLLAPACKGQESTQ